MQSPYVSKTGFIRIMLRYIRINYNYSLTSEIGRVVLPLMYAKIYMKRGLVLTKSTILSSEGITIRNFEQGDMPLLGELYNSVTSRGNAVFGGLVMRKTGRMCTAPLKME